MIHQGNASRGSVAATRQQCKVGEYGERLTTYRCIQVAEVREHLRELDTLHHVCSALGWHAIFRTAVGIQGGCVVEDGAVTLNGRLRGLLRIRIPGVDGGFHRKYFRGEAKDRR